MTNNNFNIILTGVGGQGLITLLQIIDQAAFVEGYDVRSSELHGLSQRGGSVEAHIKFGKKVFSPLVSGQKPDLIMSLEILEGLRGSIFAGKGTNILINKNILPFIGGMPEDKILENLPKKNVYLIEASKICEEKLGKEVVSSIYLLGYAVYKNLIPLKEQSVLRAIETIVPEKYRELNIRAFQLAK